MHRREHRECREKTKEKKPRKGLRFFFFLFSVFSAFSAVNSSLCLCDSVVRSNVQPRSVDLVEYLGTPAWHAQGWRGQGVKVAILDSGFRNYQAHLGTTLPKTVHVCSFRWDGNLEAKDSQHGISCAEVIHVLAPEAELLLANWEPECPDRFLAAVRWAREQGARVLCCSLIMPSWSDGEGHGRIHEELTRLLGPGDALFFASAGNTAQRHWSGPFEDGGDGYHVWRDAAGVCHRENLIHPWSSERVSVELCCPSASTYEVMISDAATEQIVGRVQSADAGGVGNAVIAFWPEADRYYQVRVRRLPQRRNKEGQRRNQDIADASFLLYPSSFHLTVLGGGLRYTTPGGSIPFPGDGGEVIAVGAVDAAGRRLAYSACGPKPGMVKPDLVARVPFPSRFRTQPFAGTSAAAPQAGALAALIWSRHPDWNAPRIRAALRNAARPCAANSPTWETGHGLLHLPPPD